MTRLTLSRLAEIRHDIERGIADCFDARDLLAELDAVTRERDEALRFAAVARDVAVDMEIERDAANG
jgi:hypothetical protein